jgi:alkanesulfonate monooxygenase SsuD/methylene tetrahydromethanopterin reductase-like flavin-dependent oxidoreductase (luciferase family)
VAFRSPEESGELIERVRGACREVGRAQDPVFSAAQVLCCGASDAEIARRAAAIGREVPELREHGLAGTPSELVEKIGRFAEARVSRVYLQVLDLTDLDHLALVASDVAPHIPRG